MDNAQGVVDCMSSSLHLLHSLGVVGKKGPEGLEDVHHCGAVDGDGEGDASDGEPERKEKIQFVPGAGVYDELH